MGHWARSFARPIRYAVSALAVFAMSALVVGTGYQYVENRRDIRDDLPPGQLVDVGGHRLHIWCTGVGSPVVVLEVGGEGNVLQWSRVQPAVAMTTRVCSYDRAGFGWSELGPNPRSAAQIVSELHSLLKAASVRGPYVLTGHSMGGLFVRLYASTYPTDVSGMVLVEATHEDIQQRMPREAGAPGAPTLWLRLGLTLSKFLTVVGYSRWSVHFGPIPGLSVETVRLAERLQVRTAVPYANEGESLALDESMTEVRQTRRVMNVPLVVVTKGRYDGLRRLPNDEQERIKKAWQDMQADLVTKTPQGIQVVAVNSEHYVQLAQPEVVIDAIQRIVTAARSATSAGPPIATARPQ